MGLKDRVILALAPWVYSLYMGFVYLTSRKTHIGFEKVWDRIDTGEKVIAALWHKDIVLAPYAYRHKEVLTIASRSRDGEVIARVMERLGFKVVRGSSSRGGGRVLKEMVEYLKRGNARIAAITVDGPRGPAGKVKPGILFLAQTSGVPIYPVRCMAKRSISLNNWDRTKIPLPFNHLIFRLGEPLEVTEGADKGWLQRDREELESRLRGLNSIDEVF
ncbi:MAG: lysophospholipid acyltransferase family protein [Deltaproteobacteria bacterium]|nr:lysophospholipid acyltransferase family protein [Deltaproteobacteria bacterium]